MKKIDTTYWKEFSVGDLFPVIKKPKVYHTREVVEDGFGIPYVVRSKFNNGIKYRIKPDGLVCSPKGVITFGAENAAFFYQEEEWCGGRDIYYIDTRNIQPYACMFIVACLNQITEKYTYSFGLFPDLLKREKIKLPTKDGDPDWQYMEDYMRHIEQLAHTSISALLDAKYKRLYIDTKYWKEFRVGDLFDIHPTKAYKLINHQLFNGGNVPVVVNSAYNNGIGGYTTNKATEHGGMITFSDTVDANTIFYQDKDFVGYPHVQGLYPIGSYATMWNAYRLRFFTSIFRKTALAKGFDYGNKFRRDIAIELKVKLPATPSGEPDWHYMEMYMRGVEAIVKNKLSLLVPHKTDIAIKDAANVTFNNANVTYIDQSKTYNVK